jgi:hypothetical protein
MHTRIIGTLQRLALPALLGPILVLAGCAPAQVTPAQVDCPPDCRLVVTLPADAAAEPEVSHTEFHVQAGQAVDFKVVGRPGGAPEEAATLLVFPVPAFVDPKGRLVHTINVRAQGSGPRYEARRCPAEAPAPCRFKYDVINHGNEERPPYDPWIIIH